MSDVAQKAGIPDERLSAFSLYPISERGIYWVVVILSQVNTLVALLTLRYLPDYCAANQLI